jgi:hypothetical protein
MRVDAVSTIDDLVSGPGWMRCQPSTTLFPGPVDAVSTIDRLAPTWANAASTFTIGPGPVVAVSCQPAS